MGKSKGKRKSRNSGEMSVNKRQATMDVFVDRGDRSTVAAEESDISERRR